MEFVGKLDPILELECTRGECLTGFRQSTRNKGSERKYM